MLEGRLAHGDAGDDRDTFLRCVCRPEPMGRSAPQTETLRPGRWPDAVGGTLTQLVGWGSGMPYARSARGCVLFVDEVAERPYRLDRLLMQLKLSGLLRRASGVVFGELPMRRA
jgi:muramoyltetrapeptide carboxypeptidase